MIDFDLFKIPVFIAECTKQNEIKQYIDQDIIPHYIENVKKQNENIAEDFYPGAVTSGATNVLASIQSSNPQQKNDDNGLSAVYSDFFKGAVKSNQKLLADLYTPDIRILMNHLGFDQNTNWQIKPYFWYNITEKGGSQDSHCHITGPQSVTMCGIHYIEFDENEHMPAFFSNPQDQIMRSIFPSEDLNLIPNYFKDLLKAPKVKQGNIVWFPPWLKHTVARQTSSKRRITIAMNLSIFN